MTSLLDHLESQGPRLAVATTDAELSYAVLAGRVAAAGDALGGGRRLVLIETRNDLLTLEHYLGALACGHVVLPVPPGRGAAAARRYDPDVVVGDGKVIQLRGGDVARDLHPDLALLLSTSGSTGSPKLVRLSRRYILSNAAAIADYLDLRAGDRAITTLPMSYCYGLSVLHTHLLSGAGVILTEHSVLDEEFWQLFLAHGATSLAGVPYTFELLERSGFDERELPSLRYVTQAGGRMAAERVVRFAELGDRRGFDLFVMYGATEATARMAYLPPHLARRHPSAIGRPVPGGRFELRPVSGDGAGEPDVGELVYHGPNVMMGYADCATDLALGPTLDALPTGDIARRNPDGIYEIIGRSSRFVKIYGLRLDLDGIESCLQALGVPALATQSDDRLMIAATTELEHAELRRTAAEVAGVPETALSVAALPALPRLANGKPDYPEVVRLVQAAQPADDTPQQTDVRSLFAEVLGVDPETVTDDSTFVDLGGNSLSYVSTSVRLEHLLGALPAGWQERTVGQLQRSAVRRDGRRIRLAALDTSVALRAAAILLIVGSHAGVFELWGGAHILLAVAGFNFGRFCLTPVSRTRRARHLWATIAWVAVPAIAWVALMLVLTDDYTWSNLLLANKILGPFDSMTAGRLWFVEVLIWSLVVLTLLLTSRWGDRLERARPFGIAAAFVALGLLLRYDVFGFDAGEQAWFTFLSFWFFALGWAAAKACSRWQQVAVTVVLCVALYGHFDDALRTALVGVGIGLLIWQPSLRCPAPVAVVAGVIAEASLYTYLTHYQVYEWIPGHPVLGALASVGVGILLTRLVLGLRIRAPRRERSVLPRGR